MDYKKERPKFITTFLIINFFLNPFLIYLFITLIPSSRDYNNLIYAGLSILQLISSIALWKWKKWGAYMIFIIAILTQVMRLYEERNPLSVFISGAISFILLSLLIRPIWKELD